MSLRGDEDVLLGTWHVERFLHYATLTHYPSLEPLLIRMLHSSIEGVNIVGARQMTLASLTNEEAGRHVETILDGSEAQQEGIAEVYAANLRVAGFREICESALVVLFNSPCERAQTKAAQCFDKFENDELAEYTALINEFANSTAFKENYRHMLRALEVSTAKLPEMTLKICEAFVNTTGKEVGDIRTGAAADSDTVINLVIRVYSQNEGDEAIQSRCLDLIDNMVELRAYGLDKALALFER